MEKRFNCKRCLSDMWFSTENGYRLFEEQVYHLDSAELAFNADLFVSIGTSNNVYFVYHSYF